MIQSVVDVECVTLSNWTRPGSYTGQDRLHRVECGSQQHAISKTFLQVRSLMTVSWCIESIAKRGVALKFRWLFGTRQEFFGRCTLTFDVHVSAKSASHHGDLLQELVQDVRRSCGHSHGQRPQNHFLECPWMLVGFQMVFLVSDDIRMPPNQRFACPSVLISIFGGYADFLGNGQSHWTRGYCMIRSLEKMLMKMRKTAGAHELEWPAGWWAKVENIDGNGQSDRTRGYECMIRSLEKMLMKMRKTAGAHELEWPAGWWAKGGIHRW